MSTSLLCAHDLAQAQSVVQDGVRWPHTSEHRSGVLHHEPPFTLRIGQNCPELDALLKASGQDTAAFITAWNPMAKTLNDEENHSRQRQLVHEIKQRSLRCIEGMGEHPSNGWRGEESVMVLGLQREAARALCVQFEQLACVVYRHGDQARLLLV